LKLLIFTPTWTVPSGLAMRPECAKSIGLQRIDGTFEHRVGLVNPFEIGDHRNVLAQYQAMQATVLAEDFDAVLTVEHDHMLPDSDAVQRLIETPGDLVYAPYLLRTARTLSLWQWRASGIGESLSFYPHELAAARDERIWRVAGVGLGCTLIKRQVLEMIALRETGPRDACPDLALAREAQRMGFISLARLDVPVVHWDGTQWLSPF